MRIAWFTHRYYPIVGGAENYGRAVVRRFVEDGHEVDVLTSDAQDLWYFTDRSRARVDGPHSTEVDGANVRRFRVRHWFGQRYAGRLLSYLPHWSTQCRYESFLPIIPGLDRVRGPYDAVFGVGFPYTNFSHAAWKTARAARAPLILTPFLHLATPGDKVNKAYTRPHQARLLRESDCVVVQTKLEADAVAGWGIARSRILVLGMAVDHESVTGGSKFSLRDRLGIPRHRRTIGHLATLDPNKGTNDLVRAVAKLNETRAAEPIHLLLAGPSSPEFETFAATLPKDASRWLTKLGALPLEQRAEFFAAIDAFAMPSRTDSYGIVFLEAWANSLPVVGADAGGVSEVIRDGENGYLVPFGDVETLAHRLARLVDDASLAQRLGSRGHEKITFGHSWDDRYRTLRDCTRELIGARTRVDPGSNPSSIDREKRTSSRSRRSMRHDS